MHLSSSQIIQVIKPYWDLARTWGQEDKIILTKNVMGFFNDPRIIIHFAFWTHEERLIRCRQKEQHLVNEQKYCLCLIAAAIQASIKLP